MKPDETPHEMLLRHLDGQTRPEEQVEVNQLLRTNPECRAFLRAVAEQSVAVADLERVARDRRPAAMARPSSTGSSRHHVVPGPWGVRARWIPLAAAAVLVALGAVLWFETHQPWTLRVANATGASQLFGARGELQTALETGTTLRAGDTLENQSCDSWIELQTRDGADLTLGGHSTLRMLEADGGGAKAALLKGSAWYQPGPQSHAPSLTLETLTLTTDAGQAQFDLQTSPTETLVRVNRDSMRVRRLLDGSEATIPAGFQASVSLSRRDPIEVVPQPAPVEEWDSQAGPRPPEVILGRWLPSADTARHRLAAQPLLWPLPDRDPVLLHVVGLSVARSSDRPVALHAGARLVFRGRIHENVQVRFGFTGQKMRGVFAGKFETDVAPAMLGPTGEPWEVSLPLSSFRPVQPQPSSSPEGLELTDVYALTIHEDVGLEIHRIELRVAQP